MLKKLLCAMAAIFAIASCQKDKLDPDKVEIKLISDTISYMKDGENAEVLFRTEPDDLFTNKNVTALLCTFSGNPATGCRLEALRDKGKGTWLAEISFNKESLLEEDLTLKALYDKKTFISDVFTVRRERPLIKNIIVAGRNATLEGDSYYVTLPLMTDFKNLAVQVSCNGESALIGGRDACGGGFSMDFDKPVTVTVKCGDASADYKLTVRNSGLPIVRIETPGRQGINSKETWIEGSSIRIEYPDGTVDLEAETSIRGRGNSTWNYPKKPYALKFSEKAEVLGMPAHKRWVLLANWKDRTLMRNDAAFFLSRQTSLGYTVRGQYVELELNGRHMGNFYLCEQIKINKNRVNIKEMDPMETDPKKITGGFLLELDTYFDEVNKFRSQYFDLPYQFKQPDEEELSPEAKQYLIDYVNHLEAILKDESRIRNHEYEEFLDVDSAIEFMFVQELANNTDFYNTWPQPGPHSYYMYKDRGGKLMTGPLWDFDYHGFVPDLSSQWAGVKKTVYYPALLKDEKFRERMMQLWEIDKKKFEGFAAHVDEMADHIRVSEEINHEMWPISNRENGDETMSFQQSVNRIKEGFQKKLDWMDEHLGMLK